MAESMRRIVSVVFTNGAISLGSKIRFGHFTGYAVVSIGVGESESVGEVIEVMSQSEDGAKGYFMIPMSRVEGIEYVDEEHLEAALKNFQKFLEEEKGRRAMRELVKQAEQENIGLSMPENEADMLAFIRHMAAAQGLPIVENDEEESDGSDGEDEHGT